MNIDLITHIEELAANAWPAPFGLLLDGWRLRYMQGITRRANSVWPNAAHEHHTLDEKIALVEATYARWGQPARYQICPAMRPANLDEVLAERGYTSSASTAVQTAALSTVLAHGAPARDDYVIYIDERYDDAWFDAYAGLWQMAAHEIEMRRTIVQHIGGRSGFARIVYDGQLVAVGLGVAERGWVGIFGMIVAPGFRRQGLATGVLHALARWGRQQQATQMYLQVMDNNPTAQTFYARVGFATLYHYYYRDAPHKGRSVLRTVAS